MRPTQAGTDRRWRLPGTSGTRAGQLVAGLYYVLYLVPIATGVAFDPGRFHWLVSGVGIATAVVWLSRRRSMARPMALVVNAVSSLGNVLLLCSLYVQGQGFNAQFFHHTDWTTLMLGWQAFGALAAGGGAYWLAVACWPMLLRRAAGDERRVRTRTVAVVLCGAILLNGAVLSLAWHIGSEVFAATRVVLVPKPRRPVVPSGIERPRSVVVIIAESLEATFSRADVVGADLTPALSRLAAEGIEFTAMHQVSHTGWTTGALVASSCAVPMLPRIRREAMGIGTDALIPEGHCLGDVLAVEGYRTVFMVGHDLGFANVGDFYAAHGFGERLGLEELETRVADPEYRSPWGLQDDTLLALGAARLDDLAAGAAPFALVVLTMDTHFPPGHPSRSCGQPSRQAQDPQRAGMRFVIRCADEVLSAFIADVRARHPDVVVVMHTDHLLPVGLTGDLLASAGAIRPIDNASRVVGMFDQGDDLGVRRLRFVIWDRRRAAQRIDRTGTHFDIMPTVLDVLGFDGWAEHGFGASLLRADSPWLTHSDPDALQFVHGAPDIVLAPGDEVVFSADGPVIEIDGTRMLATGNGLGFDDAVFAVAFDGRGRATRILSARTLDDVRDGAIPLMVGVSSNEAVNGALLGSADASLVYFAGRPDAPDFAAGSLSAGERTAVSVPGAAPAVGSSPGRLP